MLELYLIRHGQTDYSRENRFCGTSDPSLNAIGLRMAEAFADGYSGLAWDAIYASPRLRTRQTAAPLAKRVGKHVQLDEGLAEIAYGEWEGLRHEDVKAKLPEAYAYWSADVASRGTPGGETAPARGYVALAERPAECRGHLSLRACAASKAPNTRTRGSR